MASCTASGPVATRKRLPKGYYLELSEELSDYYEDESVEEMDLCSNEAGAELYVPEGMYEVKRVITRNSKVHHIAAGYNVILIIIIS